MINVNFVGFQTYLRSKITDINLHKKAVSIALGISISRMVPIPTASVDSVVDQYNRITSFTIDSFIFDFNENMIVDTDLVRETAKSFWMIRYYNAYPDTSVALTTIGDGDFLLKVSGASRYMNVSTYKFCNDNSELMTVIVNRISNLLKEKEVS